MLLLPLIAQIISLSIIPWHRTLLKNKDTNVNYWNSVGKEVISKWILSYCLFKVYFEFFAYLSGTKPGDFDPSGHLTCGIIAIANWMTLLSFISNQVANQKLSPDSLPSIYSLMLAASVYHLYGVFFTGLIYHDIFESSVGLVFGLLIYALTFLVDVFSNQLHYILTFFWDAAKEIEDRAARRLINKTSADYK